tara:strand:- start:387 stop:665 length:279 start_codon:yes stop_codon:yes gene_type:complete
MRQLNNKHYDTLEGASAHPGEIVSSQFAPSCQKDENQMTKEQKNLIVFLVRKERIRLTLALCNLSITEEEMKELNQERDLADATLESLQGGK